MFAFLPLFTCNLSFSTATPEIIVDTWLDESILKAEETRREMWQFIESRIPPLTLPETAKDWHEQSEKLRGRILDEVVFRGVPREWIERKPEVVWRDTLEPGEGYRIRKLRYEALPDLWIPSLLYEPVDVGGKVPVVLNVNGHVGPPGKAIGYEQLRCINLAKRGMLALHPEWLAFGELGHPDYKHNRLAYLDLCGLSGLAVFYLAMRGAVDVLLDLPATDPQRLGMTGLSGGGWQTIILGALDKRLSLLVPNAGYIGLENRVVQRSEVGDLEQNPTDLVLIADYTHLTAMLAPRPALLIYNEKDDCCFVADRAKPSVFDPIVPFYRLLDCKTDFEFYKNTHPGTHNYDRDNREQFYRFIHQYFLPGEPIREEIYSEGELLSGDQLHVGIPEANANFFTLAQEQLSSLPKHPPPAGGALAFQKWQEEGRLRLRNVIRLKEPLSVKAKSVRGASQGELEARWYTLTVDETWSVPVVVVSRESPQMTTIVFADDGRAGTGDSVKELVEAGSRVIAVDPLLMGESLPEDKPPSHYTMMIGTVGERSLGIQVGQISAVIGWAVKQHEVERVSLHTSGWTAGIIAIAAARLNPDKVERVLAQNALSSLKRLIEDHLDYEQCPSLFCFGLLEQFDVEELVALCSPRQVEIC